jgi:glycosyltransferase involved in cell wall biosynthesis
MRKAIMTSPEGLRAFVVFHTGDDSGPARTLEPRVRRLTEYGAAHVVFPWSGDAEVRYRALASTDVVNYRPLVLPRSGVDLVLAIAAVLRDAVTLTAAFRRRRPSIVVCVTTVVPAAVLAARMLRIPTVLYAAEIHDKGYERSRTRSALGRVLMRLEERLVSDVVACSATVGGAFRDAHVVHPGIKLAGEQPSRLDARASLRLTDSAFVVVSAGNITYGRGQDVLINAIARLPTDVVCLIAGAPHHRAGDQAFLADLARLVDELGLHGRVRLVGHVSPIEPLYAAADVIVNPARFNEPFGRVALEAVAARRPVVSARVGAAPAVLAELARFVEPGDPVALAAAIAEVRRNPPSVVELDRRRRLVGRLYGEAQQTEAFTRVVLGASVATEPYGAQTMQGPQQRRNSG